MIGKAEVTAAGDNPRFIVTNLPAAGGKGEKDRERFAPTLWASPEKMDTKIRRF